MRRSTFWYVTTLLGILIWATLSLSCAHGEEAGQRLFIQVNLVRGLPAEADPGADTGRIEVTIRGEFVGCMTAPAYTNRWNERMISPVSVGFMATGRREDVRVQLHGELGRWAHPEIIITEQGK